MLNCTKLSIVAFIIIYTVFQHGSVKAQCCSAGNPVGGDGEQQIISKNEWHIYSFYKYSNSKDYFHESTKTDITNIEKSFYDFANLRLSYGFSHRLSLHTEIGYFLNKTQDVNLSSGPERIRANGLGDLLINLKYNIYYNLESKRKLTIYGGVKLPIGAFNQTQDGVYIPISLQPSAGAYKLNAGLYYSSAFKNKKFGYISFLNYEWSNRIEKDFLIYKYGGFLQFALGTYLPISEKANFATLLKYEFRGHDKRENDLVIESTGSHVFYFSPTFAYSLPKNWKVLLTAQLPLYKYVHGYQLTNKYSYQIGIRKIIKKQ
jgi:Putative MetA-pathway of phenol degradation